MKSKTFGAVTTTSTAHYTHKYSSTTRTHRVENAARRLTYELINGNILMGN